MANTSLDIKIRAVVEGLEKFEKTRDELERIISELEDFTQPSTRAAKSIASVATASAEATDDLGNLQKQSIVLQEALESITGATSLEEIRNHAAGALESLTELGGGVGALERIKEGADGVTAEMLQTQREVTTLTDVLEDLSKVNSLDDLRSVAEDSAQALELLGDNANSAGDGTNTLNSALRNVSSSTRDTARSLQSIANSASETSDAMESSAENVGAFESEADLLTSSLNGITEESTGAADAITEVGDAATEASDATSENGGLGGSVSTLQQWFTDLRDSTSGFIEKIREFTNVGPTVAGVVGGLVGVFSKFKEQITLVVAGIAAFAAVSNLKESADLAARVETLGVTMDVVGKNTGYTTEQLAAYEKEVKGLGITSSAARETITQMASAGLELGNITGGTASQVAQLARASQDLAVRMGGSSSETLQQMITNIQQLDTEGLRYMGIILDVTKAQEKYATTLGVSTGALTQAQKQQAVMNEVLEQARSQSGLYEASMEKVGKQLGSLSRYKEELAEVIGTKLLPAYGALVQNTTQYMKDLKEIAENTDKTGAASQNWAAAMDGLSKLIFSVMEGTAKMVSEANDGFSILAATVGDILSAFANLFGVLQDTETGVLTIGSVIGGFATTVAGLIALLQDGAVIVTASFVGLGSAVLHAVGVVVETLGWLVSFLPGVGEEIMNIGSSWKAMGKEGYDASVGVIDGVLKGEGALGKFNERILQTNTLLDKAKENGAYSTIEAEITKLIEAQRKGTMQSHELATASTEVTNAITALGKEGKLTEKEIGILGAKLAAVGNKELDSFNQALTLIGVTAQELREGTTADFGEIVGGLKTLAQNANTTSDIFYGAFDRSIGDAETINDIYALNEALVAYQERLRKTGQLTEEESARIREQSQLILEKFNEVFQEGLDTSRTSDDFQQLRDDTERLGKAMVEAGVLTEEGLALKLDKISEAAEKAGKSLEFGSTIKALTDIGVSFDELTTGVSDNANTIVAALEEILVAGQLTSGQLREVFDNAIGQAKTLNDLAVIKEKIKEAFDSGKLSVADFQSAVTDLGSKFVQVFQNDLSTVTTKAELDALRVKIIEMGNSGEISGKQMAYALGEIANKAKSGSQSVLELAQNATQMADAQVRAVQAQNNAYRALLDVQRASSNLEEARNKYAEDGTELSRKMISLREQELQIAKEQYALAQMQAQMEQQNVATLIAQQQVLKAEKAATMATDAAAAQLAIAASQKNLEAEQVKGEAILQNIAKQQIMLSNLEAQKAKTQEIVSELQKAAEATASVGDEAEKSIKQSGSAGTAIAQILNANLQRSVALLKEAGYTQEESNERAKELQEMYKKGLWFDLNGGSTLGYWRMMENQLQSQIQYKKELDAQNERQAEAEKQQIQRTNEIVSNAQRMAELGYDANVTWKQFVNEGLSETSTQLQKLQAQAEQAIKASQESITSFMGSLASIKQEYLEATGQEEEALAMRYSQRKKELELEYEMLRIQVTAAKIVAKQAGESTAVLDTALKEAEEGYKQSLKYLEELERIEQEKLKKKKEEDAKAAAEKKAAEEKTAKEAASKVSQESELTKAFEAALENTLRNDPDHDGRDVKGQPLNFVFNVGGKKLEATTESTKEELLEVLEKLGARTP